ncbi:hypothetical protein Tco_1017012 [Tanacetum coccineum]|uniref:Uncharacterized protein n=1 Tax=Tanacetum coccineum TaxID=301880 RepID=A0ABQ5FS88_9ASTR
MKDKMVYKGNNVVGALMNVHIFVGTFTVVTDFAVLKDMDAYRDEGMGDVIVGEPFLREVGIKAKRFEGIIALYKSVIYLGAVTFIGAENRNDILSNMKMSTGESIALEIQFDLTVELLPRVKLGSLYNP